MAGCNIEHLNSRSSLRPFLQWRSHYCSLGNHGGTLCRWPASRRIRLRLLTEREREIVHAFAKASGASNKRIALLLGISESTLRNQLPQVFRKLGLSNRFGLFMFSERYHHQLDSVTGLNNKNPLPATNPSTAITGEKHPSERSRATRITRLKTSLALELCIQPSQAGY